MIRRMTLSVMLCAMAAAAGLHGCGAPPDPEQELRELIEAAASAAEARDTGFFRDLIASEYRDSRGNDRDRLINSLRGYFLTHTQIEVLSRVAEVELQGADAARVVVQAGMVGRRGGQPVLSQLNADLYRIELELVGGSGDWQVIGARWERALGE